MWTQSKKIVDFLSFQDQFCFAQWTDLGMNVTVCLYNNYKISSIWLCCMGCTSSSAFGMKNLSNGIQGLVWKVTLVDLGIRCILLEKLYSVSFSPMQKFFCSGNKIKLLRGPKEENRIFFTRPHFKNIINELPYLKFPQHFFLFSWKNLTHHAIHVWSFWNELSGL